MSQAQYQVAYRKCDKTSLSKMIRAVLPIAGALCCLTASICFGQSVEFGTTILPVDELSTLSGDQVKIRLGSFTFLVARSDAGERVATLYLTKQDLLERLRREDLTRLLLTVADLKETDLLQDGLQTWLLSRPSRIAIKEVAERIIQNPSSYLAFERLFAAPAEKILPEVLCYLLVTVPLQVRQSLQEHAQQLIARLHFSCPAQLEGEAKRALKDGDVNGALANLTTITELFAEGMVDLAPIVAAKNHLQALQDTLAVSDYGGVVRAARAVGEDPWLKPLIEDVSHGIVGEAALKAMAEHKPTMALRLMTAIDFEHRSVQDHELVIDALATLSPSDAEVLRLPSISKMITSFAEQDEGIKTAYIGALERLLLEAAQHGEVSNVSTILEQLKAARPEKPEENEQARIAAAEALINRGERDAGNVLLSEMGGGVPLQFRLKMLMHQAGWAGTIPAILIVVGIVCFVIVGSGWRSMRSTPERRSIPRRPGSGQGDRSMPPPRFVVYPSGLGGLRTDEYAECLQVFELERGVSLQDIKVAYRNAVKSCHPDLNPNAGPEEAERFVTLTKTYERLVELHKVETGQH